MSSSVHFKFKSQKEPSRVTFDGTSISVFNLKREIINSMKMGDGTDFELAIYNESTNEGKTLCATPVKKMRCTDLMMQNILMTLKKSHALHSSLHADFRRLDLAKAEHLDTSAENLQ